MRRYGMGSAVTDGEVHVHEPWYKYGIGVLFMEVAIAVAISVFAIAMGLSGKPVAFQKHVEFAKKPALAKPVACPRSGRSDGYMSVAPVKP